MTELLLGCLGVFLVWVTLFPLRKWLNRRHVVDVPNERSSHTVRTPRGGGLAIVAVALLGIMLYYGMLGKPGSGPVVLSYVTGALAIAVVSWLDDLRSVAKRVRFGVHALCAVLAIGGLGYWRIVSIPALGEWELGWIGMPITFLWIVGLTNAYNFMDGIDGIAGSQAVVAGLGWVVVGRMGGQPAVEVLAILLAGGCLGFLAHNWPPLQRHHRGLLGSV